MKILKSIVNIVLFFLLFPLILLSDMINDDWLNSRYIIPYSARLIYGYETLPYSARLQYGCLD